MWPFRRLDRLLRARLGRSHNRREGQLLFRPDPELASRTDQLPMIENEFQQLFTLHLSAFFVREGGHDLLCPRIDDLASRRIRLMPVDAKTDPAWEVAEYDGGHLPGRHHCGVEDVQAMVGAIHNPQLFLIRRQSDAVARTPVPLYRTRLVALNLNAVQHLPCPQIANFE